MDTVFSLWYLNTMPPRPKGWLQSCFYHQEKCRRCDFTMLVWILSFGVAPPGIAWQNRVQDDSSIFKNMFQCGSMVQWSWIPARGCHLPESAVCDDPDDSIRLTRWYSMTQWPLRDWWERYCMTSEPHGLSSVARPRVARTERRGSSRVTHDMHRCASKMHWTLHQLHVLPAPVTSAILFDTINALNDALAAGHRKSMGLPRLRPSEREQAAGHWFAMFRVCGPVSKTRWHLDLPWECGKQCASWHGPALLGSTGVSRKKNGANRLQRNTGESGDCLTLVYVIDLVQGCSVLFSFCFSNHQLRQWLWCLEGNEN